jgi:outer membrane receptor protein involved in Fe transport
MKKFVLIVSVVIMASLNAGTVGKIAGTITDKNTGETLIGVNVLVEGTDFGAASDLDGTFIILNMPPGSYNLVFNYIGYQDVIVSGVRVSIDFTTRLDVQMSESSMEMDVVEVVAQADVIRKDQTSSMAVVDDDLIKELPVDNVSDVLQIKAGITKGADGALHIRGGRASEISYMVDGVSATDVFDGSVAYDVDKDAVSELQVISGTFNAEYGQAMSGIVNIVTKDGDDNYSGRLNVFSGGFLADDGDLFNEVDTYDPLTMPNIQANFSGPIIPGKLFFFVSGRYQENDGYYWGRREYYPDGREGDGKKIAMNWSKNAFGQAKITWRILPEMKLSYNLITDYRNWQDYDHGRKLSPDGRLEKFEIGINNTLNFNHTLSPTTFYTVNFSFFSKDYEHYAYEDITAYDAATNTGYVNPRIISENYLPSTSYSFTRGYTDNNRFNRETQTFIGKIDFNHQADEHHLIKAGFEYKSYDLFYKNVNLYESDENIFPFNPETDHTSFVIQVQDPNFTKYTRTPLEYSMYIQDKMEYGDFVLNFGLRYDAFDPNTRVPKEKYSSTPDIYSSEFYDDEQITASEESEFYENTTVKNQLSPRIGVAYSVTENSKFHFSYGRFLKMPTMSLLFENVTYTVLPVNKYNNLTGNPNLKPEKTAAYEVGFSSLMTDDISFSATAFYKDIRDYVGTSLRPIIWDNNPALGYGYFEYINLDYANVRGFTFELNKAFSSGHSFSVDYTYMISEGSSSNPGEYFSGELTTEEVNRFIFPLDWDQRHTLNGTLYLDIEGWGLSLIGRASSGQPYTPSYAQGSEVGRSSIRYFEKNLGRKPVNYNLDMNVRKTFEFFAGYKTSFYVKVYNILDIRNEIHVYGDTGSSDYSTAAELQREDEIREGLDDNPDFVRWGTYDEYMLQPWRYSAPRQIQFGTTLEF